MFSFFKSKKRTHKPLPNYWEAYALRFTHVKEIHEGSRFVVLDTETTGFDYERDRILCIGAVVLIGQKIFVKESFESFLVQDHYNKESAAIHGILKNERIKKVSELEGLKHFLAFIGNSVLVAHHTKFDITMINKALKRHKLPPLKNKTLDTVKLYQKSLIKSPLVESKESYGLDELADKFNLSKKDRHTALGDAYITALLFIKILKRIKEKEGRIYFKKLF